MAAQARFNFKTEKKSVQKKRDEAALRDLECAEIIAADPERYPGLMQESAALVLGRIERANEAEQGTTSDLR